MPFHSPPQRQQFKTLLVVCELGRMHFQRMQRSIMCHVIEKINRLLGRNLIIAQWY